jgi:hypothetical protein
MVLTRMLKHSDTVGECQVLFVVLSGLGLLCLILLYVACWSEAYILKGLFLAAIAYCVPGAILFFFVASLYFVRWQILSCGAGAKSAP